MKLRILVAADIVSHKILDPICQFKILGRWHLPGWGRLQVWQWHLCNWTEREYDRTQVR